MLGLKRYRADFPVSLMRVLVSRRRQVGDIDFMRAIAAFRAENDAGDAPSRRPPGESKVTICVRKRPISSNEVSSRRRRGWQQQWFRCGSGAG